MPHPRFLKFYAPWDRRQSNVYIPTTLEPFSAKLRYLEWNSYPLNSLPSRFCAEKLVEIRMPYSEISKLWDGKQDLENLTVLDLRGCIKLVELPDFGKATKLKTIYLCYCEKLCQLHPSILYIQTLEQLHLNGCKELKSVKGNWKSLKGLYATNCSSLEEFSVSSEKLRNLCLCRSRIKSLPNEFCCLTSLKQICLCNCTELIELPDNIKALSRLTTLEVSGCCGLRCIPELPPSIEEFRAVGCTSLERVFSLKAVFSLNRRKISFVNCKRLEEESVNDIMEDAHLTICRNILLWSEDRYLMNYDHYLDMEGRVCYPHYLDMVGHVCYPGYKVPKWFRFQAEEASISRDYFDEWGGVGIKCEYSIMGDGLKHMFVHKEQCVVPERRWISDHVFIWTDIHGSYYILSKINSFIGNDDDDESPCNQKISFRFIADRQKSGERQEYEDSFIKGCGVFPMYDSALVDAIQNIQLEFELNPHHNSIPRVNLDSFKNEMIRRCTGKSKLRHDSCWLCQELRRFLDLGFSDLVPRI
ncbi:hypothetical protein PIB30_033368 [Stylosanthes scabra]|uniref:Uncharacterized protein n=1 Tax=Stylosanthes scabra TaxID=79078 RepID=A0ABU6YB33_9FABA|nr:hypothetical protein [Stylosanthes scabra]